MKKATISDVARLAGVSIKSVSRVVNREANVRTGMRAKVEAAIEELGYKPNLAARSLAAGRSLNIGVLFDNPSPHYTMKVQEGAYVACRDAGYQLVLEHLESAAQIDDTLEMMFVNRRVDGVVVTAPATDHEIVLHALEQHRIPYVRIAPNRSPERSPAIFSNDSQAMSEVVQLLWGLGHRQFGFVSGPVDHGASAWRRAGFFSALAERGMRADQVSVANGDFTFASGIGAGLQLLRRPVPPTAIFAANDDMAAGVFAAAAQLSIRIPEALSVVGFDDSWIAKSVWPELTTMRQPIVEMAQDAVEILVQRQRWGRPTVRHHKCTFIVRGSTGPVGR